MQEETPDHTPQNNDTPAIHDPKRQVLIDEIMMMQQ
jgi:hypothetical protein